MIAHSSEINDYIEKLMEKSNIEYEKGNIPEAKNLLINAFNAIPDPKEAYNESYNYCSYVLNFILDEGLAQDEIENWLNKLIEIADKQKIWSGTIDFHKGKAYFELGNYEESLAALKESVKEAKGFRYFEDEDPKYLDFFNNPEKYMK